ncbi:MAG TPA: hypothetical protein VMR80_08870, partial [Candidatus Acidoferrum sp.]|nr:hypothetical protein [Candidatus Acidoferrum sp.]
MNLSHRVKATACRLAFVVLLGSGAVLFSQTDSQLKPNQTFGYGENKIVKFTYTQSFDCVDEPHDDLNFNGKKAQSDPGEFQIPVCQVGINPTVDPSGLTGNADPTEPLYVLVPMFSVDNDQNPDDAISCKGVMTGTNCGPALGSTLIKLFGALPEAFKAKPLIHTQCPDPGLPAGTCTMHASRLDLGPVLVKLGFLPPPVTNIFVPSPNHSHVVLGIDVNIQPIWWQVIPVLVLDQADWPDQDGDRGITSVVKI